MVGGGGRAGGGRSRACCWSLDRAPWCDTVAEPKTPKAAEEVRGAAPRLFCYTTKQTRRWSAPPKRYARVGTLSGSQCKRALWPPAHLTTPKAPRA